MDLAGKIALVTGAGRGIGKAISLKMAEQGASIAVNDIDEATAQTLVNQIKAAGGQAMTIKADVSRQEDVEAMAEAVKAEYGRIDILVNNAGITRDQILLRMQLEDWEKVMDINLKSVFLVTRAVVRSMMKQRYGRIVNIASIVGIIGNAGQANYSAAKAGIIGFTRTIAKEFGSRGITSNAIAPGFIDTEMTQKLGDERREELKKNIPLGFLGNADDVAEAAVFLASDKARYITGQVLNVDGGISGSWL